MLAGRMKLKTFLGVLGLGGAATAAGGGYLISQREPAPEVAQPLATNDVTRAPLTTPPPSQAAAPPATTPPATEASNSNRAVDTWLLGQQGKDLGTSKKKDATKGKAYKVNLYQDDGHSAVNRAKIDLDRDDRWDEKWTFADDGITRQVAPLDDEDYTQTFHWTGSDWTAE